MVGRCISYWNSPFLGDMSVFWGVCLFSPRILGEMIQVDSYFFRGVGSTTKHSRLCKDTIWYCDAGNTKKRVGGLKPRWICIWWYLMKQWVFDTLLKKMKDQFLQMSWYKAASTDNHDFEPPSHRAEILGHDITGKSCLQAIGMLLSL